MLVGADTCNKHLGPQPPQLPLPGVLLSVLKVRMVSTQLQKVALICAVQLSSAPKSPHSAAFHPCCKIALLHSQFQHAELQAKALRNINGMEHPWEPHTEPQDTAGGR